MGPLSMMVFSPFLLPQEELRPFLFAGWPVTSTFLDVQVMITCSSHSKGFDWTKQNLLGDPFQEHSLLSPETRGIVTY